MKRYIISFVGIIILVSGLVASLKLIQTSQNPRIKADIIPTPISSTGDATVDALDCPPGQVLTKEYLPKDSFDQAEVGGVNDHDKLDARWICTGSTVTTEAPTKTFAELNCGCGDNFDPVCGSDYYNYPNGCVAGCKGVKTAYQGTCRVYQKDSLPSGCQACATVCSDGQVFYEDEHGCPVCECQVEAAQF